MAPGRLAACQYDKFINKTQLGSSYWYMASGQETMRINSNKTGSDWIQGENFLPGRTDRQWNRLPREDIQSPFSEICKTQLDKAQQNPVGHHSCPALSKRLDFLRSLPT